MDFCCFTYFIVGESSPNKKRRNSNLTMSGARTRPPWREYRRMSSTAIDPMKYRTRPIVRQTVYATRKCDEVSRVVSVFRRLRIRSCTCVQSEETRKQSRRSRRLCRSECGTRITYITHDMQRYVTKRLHVRACVRVCEVLSNNTILYYYNIVLCI